MKRSRRQRLLRGTWGERGQTLVEFAFVSIAFFIVMFAIFDGARLFQSWVTLQHAARSGARYAVTGRITCSEYPSGNNRDNCIRSTGKGATRGLAGGGQSGTDISVTFLYWDYPAYSGSGSAGAGLQCDAVEVSVSYTHHFVFPVLDVLAPSGVSVIGRQRMVNEPFGPCS